MSEGQCILTSLSRLQRSGSPSGWAASGSLHSALKCSPPPGPEGYTDGQTERVIWLGLQDRGSAVTSQSAPKPTDPALSLGLDNATQQALTSTHTRAQEMLKTRTLRSFFSLMNTTLTSISVWKLNKSIFCQLLPSRARTFHAWEGDRHVVQRDRKMGQTEVEEGELWLF